MNIENKITESEQRDAKKSILVSIIINILLAFMQITVGFFSKSQSLIADGVHSFTDLVSDFVVLLARHYAAKAADDDHNYGHQRYETAASLFLGVSLGLVGVGMLMNAIENIIVQNNNLIQITALYITITSLIIKETLFRYMLSIAKKIRSSVLIANAWHARSDAASSLVVMFGVAGSLLGYQILDPVAALIIGLMIIKTGAKCAFDALNDLMDKAASKEEYLKIKTIIESVEGVRGFHDLKTRKMGDMILVDVHIEVDANATVKTGHDIAVAAKEKIMKELHVLNVMTHIDPV